MIVYNLTCAKKHTFEGWFASGEAFDRQSDQGQVTCPVCGDHHVTRAPSSPHLRRASAQAPRSEVGQDGDLERLLEGLRQVMEDSEDVGEAFAQEARRIHYMEAPLRSIRGVATLGDTAELLEEGIPVLPLSVPLKKDLH
ncbi:MAG: DUF1178 family protein [Rhodocyclaceae bacterium]|nr:DUF1178 family protein [Rhodocyclaceae bacterium]